MNLWNNIRFALRLLRKSPAFTITVLATLALCIGANTAIFSVLDALYFQTLPYPDSNRLVMIGHVFHRNAPSLQGHCFFCVSENGTSNPESGQTGRTWQIIRDHATYLSPAIYMEGSGGVNLYLNGRTAYVQQQRVGANFFHVLGIQPLLGHTWTRAEDHPGGPNLAILSYAAWQHFFDGNPSALGRTIDLRGAPFTVIGIMPKGFHTNASAADLWTPLQPSTTGEGSGSNYHILARLKPGVTLAQASGQLTSIMASYWKDRHLPPQYSVREIALPLQSGTAAAQDLTGKLRLMFAAAFLVLLIGCVNIAGLLLSRSAARSRELTTRMALGASRAAILNQLLTESLLLAAGGGLLGLLVGEFALEGLSYISSHAFTLWTPVYFNATVGFVSFGVALATGLLFGLFPAWQATNIDLRAGLAESGRNATAARHAWSRQVLVFAEVALGVTLVIAAGLLVRTLTGLMNLNPGFDPHNVTTASVVLNDARYKTTAAGVRLFRDTLDRIRQIPGIESASVTLNLPFAAQLNDNIGRILASNREIIPKNSIVNLNYATPGLFKTLRIPLLQGRTFTAADGPNARKVTVVNDAFVRHFLPDDPNPIGDQIQSGVDWLTIVGVVKSVPQQNGWGGHYGPLDYFAQMYRPAAQWPDTSFLLVNSWFAPSFVVRTHGHIAGLRHAMEQAIAAADPRLPFSRFQEIDDVLAASVSNQRYMAVLFSSLAGLALLLAAIGVYGLVAQSVAERTREMGIRLALGATPRHIVRQAAAPGIFLALAGVACGLILSFFAARLLTSLIYGVSPTDPLTFIAVACLLIAVAALASILPALRLAHLDPAQTLRDE